MVKPSETFIANKQLKKDFLRFCVTGILADFVCKIKKRKMVIITHIFFLKSVCLKKRKVKRLCERKNSNS